MGGCATWKAGLLASTPKPATADGQRDAADDWREEGVARLGRSPVLGGLPTMMLGYAPEVGAEAGSIARDFDEVLLGVGQTRSEAKSDERQIVIRFPELIGELDRSPARCDLKSFGRLGSRPNIGACLLIGPPGGPRDVVPRSRPPSVNSEPVSVLTSMEALPLGEFRSGNRREQLAFGPDCFST